MTTEQIHFKTYIWLCNTQWKWYLSVLMFICRNSWLPSPFLPLWALMCHTWTVVLMDTPIHNQALHSVTKDQLQLHQLHNNNTCHHNVSVCLKFKVNIAYVQPKDWISGGLSASIEFYSRNKNDILCNSTSVTGILFNIY